MHGLTPLADSRQHLLPALRHAFLLIRGEESERRVPELDERPAVRLGQPILHVRDDAGGHEQGPGELEQGRSLDGLYVAPEVAVVVAEVAVPPAAGPRLDLQLQGLALRGLVPRPQLFEKGGEGRVQRRLDVGFQGEIERQILDAWCGRDHGSSLGCDSVRDGSGALWRSARSLTRFSWCRQRRSNWPVHSWSGRSV